MAGIVSPVFVGTLLIGPIAVAVAGSGALILGYWKSSVAHNKAEDPPRIDYTEPTFPQERIIDPSPFGSDALSIATLELLRVGGTATAYEAAMVLADERAQGARLESASWAASSREEEAGRWGEAAAHLNQELAQRAADLADILEAYPDPQIDPDTWARIRSGSPGRASQLLPVSRRMLMSAGLDDNAVPFPDGVLDYGVDSQINPFRDLGAALRRAGESSSTFGLGYLRRDREVH